VSSGRAAALAWFGAFALSTASWFVGEWLRIGLTVGVIVLGLVGVAFSAWARAEKDSSGARDQQLDQ